MSCLRFWMKLWFYEQLGEEHERKEVVFIVPGIMQIEWFY